MRLILKPNIKLFLYCNSCSNIVTLNIRLECLPALPAEYKRFLGAYVFPVVDLFYPTHKKGIFQQFQDQFYL